jgi:hypothetical protein
MTYSRRLLHRLRPESENARAEFLRRLTAQCPVTAAQIRLIIAFNLRVREALQIRPVDADLGRDLRVSLPNERLIRTVPIETDEQRQPLLAAKNLVSGDGCLRARPALTFARALRHFYFMIHKVV